MLSLNEVATLANGTPSKSDPVAALVCQSPLVFRSAGAHPLWRAGPTMNLNLLYDLPTWLFAILTIAAAVAIGLAGFYATRNWVRGVHGDELSHSDIVGFFLGTIGLFYGITLGLVAVGTWQTYSNVDTQVDQEAATLAALYRDVSNFPEP